MFWRQNLPNTKTYRNYNVPFFLVFSDVNCSYKTSTNSIVKEHPLYDRVYLWVSEALLRFGPIVTLTILNILIIVRYNRIARKREVLKGTPAALRSLNYNGTPSIHRANTSTSNGNGNGNGNVNQIRRSASPVNGNGSTINGNGGTLLTVPTLEHQHHMGENGTILVVGNVSKNLFKKSFQKDFLK
jgi:hypothetical protein